MKLAIMYSQKPNGTQAVRGTIEDIDGVIRCSSGMESIVQAMRQSCAIEKGYYHLAEHGLPIIDRWPSAAETLAHIRDHYDDYVPGRLRVLEARNLDPSTASSTRRTSPFYSPRPPH